MAGEDAGALWEPCGERLRKVAKDAETESADLERAASLYVGAEVHVSNADLEKAISKATEALELFKTLEHWSGNADAVRLLAHVRCMRDERKEAAQLVLEELKQSKALRDDSPVLAARAKLLLAQAEVNSDGRGNRKRDEALASAREARSIFRSLKETHLEGTALLAQVAINAKRRCPADEKGQEILKVAREAQPLFKSLGEKRGEAQTLHWVGVAFGLKEMYQDAMKAAGEAKDLFRLAGDILLEAQEAQLLALWNLKEQDPQKAVVPAEDALRLLKESGYRGEMEASATQTLVEAHIACGDGQEALKVAQQFLMRAQISLDKKMEVEALLLTSKSYLAGDSHSAEDLQVPPCPLEALEAAERALQLARDLKDEECEARIMALLNTLYVRRQEFEQASAAAKLAVQKVGGKDLEAEGASLQELASSMLAKGDIQEALRKAEAARELFRSHGHAEGEASSLLLVAQVQFELDRVDQAVATTKDAQIISQDIEDKKGIGSALMQIAEFRSASGEHGRAVHAADRARMHVIRYGDKAMEARMWLLAAQNRTFALVKKTQEAQAEERRAGYEFRPGWEEVAKAAAAAKEAVKIGEELGDARAVGNALCVVAQMHIFTQRFEHALAAAEEAMVRFVELGDVRSEASILVMQAQVFMAMGNFKKSLNLARQGLLLFQQAADERGEAVATAALAGLRRYEFVVDERGGGQMMLPADEDERALAVASDAGGKGAKLDASYVNDTIQKVTRKMVGADEDMTISADNPLMDIGITSMNAVLFRNKLGQEFEGVDLPVTLVFDYPSIRDLTSLIIERARE
mmetsp:Transcript_82551/g.242213  ORF Transcript_82551/g.242213 Transcript_82551/m.242213 type:complete len:810 (+) Transcript_82551:123-2552(+)